MRCKTKRSTEANDILAARGALPTADWRAHFDSAILKDIQISDLLELILEVKYQDQTG